MYGRRGPEGGRKSEGGHLGDMIVVQTSRNQKMKMLKFSTVHKSREAAQVTLGDSTYRHYDSSSRGSESVSQQLTGLGGCNWRLTPAQVSACPRKHTSITDDYGRFETCEMRQRLTIF